MQAVCSTSASCVRPVAVAKARTAARPAVCHAQQVRKVAQAAKAAAISLPALVAAHPALALVDDRLGGEGTGKILGIGGAEGWAIIGAFAATWAIFYASTRELGGDAGDDSGMTL
eukprot:jgi/Astpho2/2208/Aster-x0514